MANLRTITITQTTTGASTSDPYPVNWKADNYMIGLGVTMTAAKGIEADVEHTFDDPKVGLTDWFKHDTLKALTTSADGNYAYPITALRLVVVSATASGGTTNLKIVQSN